MEDFLKSIYDEAEKLAGRPVEVVKTKDNKYVVEWFAFGKPPPPKADCPEDALCKFIQHLRSLPKLPADEVPEFENND